MLIPLLLGSPVNAPEIRVLVAGADLRHNSLANINQQVISTSWELILLSVSQRVSSAYPSWCLLTGYRLRLLVLLAKLIKICLSCI